MPVDLSVAKRVETAVAGAFGEGNIPPSAASKGFKGGKDSSKGAVGWQPTLGAKGPASGGWGSPWDCGEGAWGGSWDEWGYGKGKGIEKGAGKATGNGPPTSTGKVYMGALKYFSEANNYGFIDCEEVKIEHGNDTFVHGRSLQNLDATIGTRLEFELGISAKGQPQAMNVRLEGGVAPAPAFEEPAFKKARTESQNSQGYQQKGNGEDIDLGVLLGM